MIKPHNIILTFFVFIYIPPIYIFWKSSPLPQSIVHFISTHTIKSHNKIIPQNHSNLTNKSHTSPLQSHLSQHIPSHKSNIITPLITPFIQHPYFKSNPLHTPIYIPISNIITLITSISLTPPNTPLSTRIFPLHNTINILHI